MSENNEEQNHTLSILRNLYLEGEKIQKSHLENVCGNELKARGWVECARVLFTHLFYNSMFLERFERIVNDSYNPREDCIDYQLAVHSLLGHIRGIGLSLKNGYIKDQYAGIDNSHARDVFVAMSFAPEFEDNYNIGIMPALNELGFNPIRMDRVHHNEKIDTKIFQLIANSRFIVADFSGQRTGVYYEAGYAAGLGLPVVQICNSLDFENLHFDIKTINTIKFNTPFTLKPILIARIEETIGRYREQDVGTANVNDDIPF